MLGRSGIVRFVRRGWRSLPLDGAGVRRGGPAEARRLRAFVAERRWRSFAWWIRPVLIPAMSMAWLAACPIAAAQAVWRQGGRFSWPLWLRLTLDGWAWGVHPAAALSPETGAELFRPIRVETLHQRHWGLAWRWLGAEECLELAQDKAASAAALRGLGVATPDILQEIPAGSPVNADTLPWSDGQALFVKPRHGSRGSGALSVTVLPDGNFLVNSRRLIDKVGLDLILTRNARHDSLLVQPHLSPSPQTGDLSPWEPVQLRISVARRPRGEPFVYSCFAKILQRGRYGATVPSGALAVAVDPVSGRMGQGILLAQSQQLHDTVPWTGARIEGRTIPDYAAAAALVLRGSQALPDLPVIGWDVLLTDRGPVVLEANTGLSYDYLHLLHAMQGGRPTLLALIVEWIDYVEAGRVLR